GHSFLFLSFSVRRLPPCSTLFPYTTLFRSHDFVEAALLSRAGWGVYIAYDLGGSYEEVPPTLLEELGRDRRWCRGNIQHFRLLRSEEHTSELQSRFDLVCRLLLEKKKTCIN